MKRMFGWITERRRRHLEAEPFPEAWEEILKQNMGHYRLLDDGEREHLRKLVQVFVAEKHWEGAGGLELTDEVRVTVAGEACLMLLGRDHSLYRGVQSIVVYPSAIVRPKRGRSFFDPGGQPDEGEKAVVGEAHLDGPVLLSWDAAKKGARNPRDGRNVVIHEFAHKIDMLDRRADGTPPLESREARQSWAEIASEVYLELRRRTERGRKSFLDAYGATNEAEFFAVATEHFFEQPIELEQQHRDLYGLLRDYYNQDPADRVRRSRNSGTR